MRKLNILMLVLVVVLLATTETMEVKAVVETVYYSPQNARFQYDTGSTGSDNYLWAQFDTAREYYDTPNNNENGRSDYNLYVKQYDHKGFYIQTAFIDLEMVFDREETRLEINYYGTCNYTGSYADLFYYADGSLGEVGEIIRVVNSTQSVEYTLITTPIDPSTSPPYYSIGDYEGNDNSEYYVRFGASQGSPASCTQGDSIIITYELIQGQQWFYDRLMTFTSLDFDYREDGMYYYKIFLNDKIVNSGAFMTRPSEDIDFSGNEGIEIGKYFREGYKSSYDLEDYTYLKNDDFYILHYNLSNVYTYGSQGREVNIIFTDITTNTIEFSFNTTDLLMYQNWSNMYATGQLTDDVINSFIIIPTSSDSRILDLLNTDIEGLNDRTIIGDFDYGVYLPTLYDFDTPIVIDHNTTLLINTIQTSLMPFSFYIESDELEIEEMQRWVLSKRDVNISTAYTTILAKDNIMNYDYSILVNDLGTDSFNTRYRTTDYVGTIGTQWILEPVSMPYSLDPSDYQIELTETYTSIDTSSTEKTIFDLFAYYGVDDEGEQFLVFIGIMIIINLITLFIAYSIGNLLVPTVVVNIFMLFIGSYLGLIPIWLIIGVVLILIIMVFALLNVGGGEE